MVRQNRSRREAGAKKFLTTRTEKGTKNDAILYLLATATATPIATADSTTTTPTAAAKLLGALRR